jgi:hypothetical protein
MSELEHVDPSQLRQKHEKLTVGRAQAYAALFGGPPSSVFTPDALFKKPDERFLIDIFVYTLATKTGDIEVAVTNGMSDQRMADCDDPQGWHRRELIQYFPKCTEGYAHRLHLMAWLPLFDGFYLDTHHSVAWPYPAVEGTPWKHALFLPPLVKSHREFVFEVDGDKVSFLWHIPISDEERAFKQEHGPDALIARMDAVGLPWVFDENNRPSLLEEKGNGL